MEIDQEESGVMPCAEKMAFDTKAEAAATAAVALLRYGNKLKPYLCQHCNLWHISSHAD